MAKPKIIEDIESLQIEVTNARNGKANLKTKIDEIDTTLTGHTSSLADSQTQINNKLNDNTIYLKDFSQYVVNNDWSSALNNVLTGITTATTIVLPNSLIKIQSQIDLPNISLKFKGEKGCEIHTENLNIIFNQTNHVLTEFQDITFSGNGTCVKFNTTQSAGLCYDLSVKDCIFNLYSTGRAIYLNNARESIISHCFFNGGDGIYITSAVNPQVTDCIFSNNNFGIWQNGDNTAFSCGLMMENCTVLGATYGVKIERSDNFLINNCMIDYCDNPFVTIGQFGGLISNCYLGARSTYPIVRFDKDIPLNLPSNFITISNCFLFNYQTSSCDGIVVNYCNDIKIVNNQISHFTNIGIVCTTVNKLTILGNMIESTSGYGTYSITTDNADLNSICRNNRVTLPITWTYMNVSNNIGFVTENSGVSTLPANSGTAKAINHGLSIAPRKVFLSFDTLVSGFKVVNITSTQFTYVVDKTYTTDVQVYWKAEY